jgi:hypothetical protein
MVTSSHHSSHSAPSKMSVFEPGVVLAQLRSLEPNKDQKAFEEDFKRKVSSFRSLVKII